MSFDDIFRLMLQKWSPGSSYNRRIDFMELIKDIALESSTVRNFLSRNLSVEQITEIVRLNEAEKITKTEAETPISPIFKHRELHIDALKTFLENNFN